MTPNCHKGNSYLYTLKQLFLVLADNVVRMTSPRRIPSSAEPARIVSGEAETHADLAPTPASGGMHKVNPDAFTQAGKSAAAKAMVAVGKSARVQQTMGLSPLLDAASAFARSGYETRIITEQSALELAKELDGSKSGFEARLVHMLLERTLDQALIGSRSRQRLSSSLNQAFGRTNERLDPERASNVDNLGIFRGEQGFTDTLLEQLSQRRMNTAAVVTAIKDIKTADALTAAYEAISKIFPSSAFPQSDRVKVLSAFLQTQGRLRANVVKITPGAGLMAPRLSIKERHISPWEKSVLGTHLKNAPVDELKSLKHQVIGIVATPLFGPKDCKSILAGAEQRLMLLQFL